MLSRAILVGAGTYGQVYAAYLKDCYRSIEFVDDDPRLSGHSVSGWRVVGAVADLSSIENRADADLFVAIGNNKARCRILALGRSLGFRTPSYIHPTVDIHESIELRGTVYVLPGTHIMPFSSVGDGVMISVGVSIAHHSQIGDGVFLSQGSNVGASIDVGKNTFVGMSAVLMTGVESVGQDVVVGAGAIVIRDVPDNATVVGNPARII